MRKIITMICVIALVSMMILTVSAKTPLGEMGKWTLIEKHERDENYDEMMMLDPTTQTLYGVLIGHDGSIPGGCVVIPCEGDRFGRYIRSDDNNTVVWYDANGIIINTYTITWTTLDKVELYDIKADAWYALPVVWATANNITNGTTPTTFSPNKNCTRAEIVTFLWRAAGSPEPTSKNNPFADVDPNAYYGKAVLWAVENGITNGTTPTTFSPNKNCTRAEIVTFLWRFENSPTHADNNNFSDANSGYYAPAVSWAVGNGITNGTTSTTFSPNKNCTRAEAVTLLYRLLSI